MSFLQILYRWQSHKRIHEPGVERCAISQEPAHENVLDPVECWWLGHQGWACENRLVPSPFLCLLQKLQCRGLCLVVWSIFLLFSVIKWWMANPRDGLGEPREAELGAEELHDLQLLHWFSEVSPRPPCWVLHCLIARFEKLLCETIFSLFYSRWYWVEDIRNLIILYSWITIVLM